MTTVASFCMSLDGFVARPDDSVGPLFDWYTAGDVELPMVGYPITFRVATSSAGYLRELLDSARHSAFVCGRRVFDHTHGWGGNPPGGGKAFVVTHRPPPPDWSAENLAPFTFVGDVATAIERAKAAGNGDVGVSGPDIARQCLRLGLLDEVRIDLVPVFLGEGVRYFDDLGGTGAELERVEVVAGDGVTHLRYRVHYPS
ncbi:dihydrofolate reductase family protein [Amycolatopsis sp. FBCC-B4732]|uniref:dihydrofolate reductase family protein n=1 Tax=Amycolatopsis sp. FBCC-B4732 TaxID=3079339 RepID=UPI001FF1E7AB|nr:dihydrofolate reductase family protein [Amycolatopsis sp. FBCC-B4732]UOX86023.1 dihydrofolate reductase family protein [Amycolatopsis sp. FBCC-B4732]